MKLLPLLTALLLPLAAYAGDACPASRATTLHLPHVRATLARNHELLIVALGSSSTVSWMSSDIGHSYPAVLQDELSERLPDAHIAVINRGIGGQDAAQEIPRLETDVLPIRPQLVIWQVGANDVLKAVDPAEFARQVSRGIAILQAAGTDVILMDNQRSPRILAAADHAAIDDALREVALHTGVSLFGRGALMDAWRTEGYPYARFVAADNLHHNDLGYHCIADALADDIQDSLGPRLFQARLTRQD